MVGVGLATNVATAVGVPGAIDVASVTGMPIATGNVGPGAGLVVKAATTASWGNGGAEQEQTYPEGVDDVDETEEISKKENSW